MVDEAVSQFLQGDEESATKFFQKIHPIDAPVRSSVVFADCFRRFVPKRGDLEEGCRAGFMRYHAVSMRYPAMFMRYHAVFMRYHAVSMGCRAVFRGCRAVLMGCHAVFTSLHFF